MIMQFGLREWDAKALRLGQIHEEAEFASKGPLFGCGYSRSKLK